MKDRQPYPGKEGLMKHTPCDASGVPTGAPAYYAKVDMADSPLEIGTSFSKANILSDTTAALINTLVGSTPSTPDAALSAITGKTQTLYNGRVQIATGSYTGTGTSGPANPITISFGIDAKILILMSQFNTEETRGITPIVISAVKSISSVDISLGAYGSAYISLGRASDDTSGNASLKFYCKEQDDAEYLNPSGKAVSWVAIGQGDLVL